MDHTQAALVFAVLAAVLGLLIFTELAADLVLFGGLSVLMITGVVGHQEALSGFANEGMMTVGLLFVVAAGLRQTGAVYRLSRGLLGDPRSLRFSLARLVFPVAGASAMLNNTPIVAALLPAVTEWARRHRLPLSKFLIPLSYGTILGGTITVIGTSTNLVVAGLIERNLANHPGLHPLGIFSISPIGVPVALVGCSVLVLVAPWLLPDRRPALSRTDDPREFTSEFLVAEGGPLVFRTIEEAGLRNLPGAFLAELDRDDTVLPAVDPHTHLRAGDRLVFVGPRESVVDLARIAGLLPAPDRLFGDQGPGGERRLVEAVVGPANVVLGRTLRDGRFRTVYDAVVVAMARDGLRLGGKLGNAVLETGDVLLLEVSPDWVDAHRDRRDFYLVSEVPDSTAFRHEKAWIALVLLALMVGGAATGWISMFHASLLGAAAMMGTGCLTVQEARQAIEWPVLIAISSAFGIGEGIRLSGADQVLAEGLVGIGAETPYTALIAMYLATALLTELVTNNAAAALMFPFALSLSAHLGVSPMPYCVGVMFAASASFSTPIGYQTNMMVYGPGGYRFTDFVKAGLVLQVAVGTVTLTLLPLFFPF